MHGLTHPSACLCVRVLVACQVCTAQETEQHIDKAPDTPFSLHGYHRLWFIPDPALEQANKPAHTRQKKWHSR